MKKQLLIILILINAHLNSMSRARRILSKTAYTIMRNSKTLVTQKSLLHAVIPLPKTKIFKRPPTVTLNSKRNLSTDSKISQKEAYELFGLTTEHNITQAQISDLTKITQKLFHPDTNPKYEKEAHEEFIRRIQALKTIKTVQDKTNPKNESNLNSQVVEQFLKYEHQKWENDLTYKIFKHNTDKKTQIEENSNDVEFVILLKKLEQMTQEYLSNDSNNVAKEIENFNKFITTQATYNFMSTQEFKYLVCRYQFRPDQLEKIINFAIARQDLELLYIALKNSKKRKDPFEYKLHEETFLKIKSATTIKILLYFGIDKLYTNYPAYKFGTNLLEYVIKNNMILTIDENILSALISHSNKGKTIWEYLTEYDQRICQFEKIINLCAKYALKDLKKRNSLGKTIREIALENNQTFLANIYEILEKEIDKKSN